MKLKDVIALLDRINGDNTTTTTTTTTTHTNNKHTTTTDTTTSHKHNRYTTNSNKPTTSNSNDNDKYNIHYGEPEDTDSDSDNNNDDDDEEDLYTTPYTTTTTTDTSDIADSSDNTNHIYDESDSNTQHYSDGHNSDQETEPENIVHNEEMDTPLILLNNNCYFINNNMYNNDIYSNDERIIYLCNYIADMPLTSTTTPNTTTATTTANNNNNTSMNNNNNNSIESAYDILQMIILTLIDEKHQNYDHLLSFKCIFGSYLLYGNFEYTKQCIYDYSILYNNTYPTTTTTTTTTASVVNIDGTSILANPANVANPDLSLPCIFRTLSPDIQQYSNNTLINEICNISTNIHLIMNEHTSYITTLASYLDPVIGKVIHI